MSVTAEKETPGSTASEPVVCQNYKFKGDRGILMSLHMENYNVIPIIVYNTVLILILYACAYCFLF